MSIRVRKLARQLRCPPVELLGILHTLGFERYKSPEDMLSGRVEQRLRAAVKEGVKPKPVEPQAVRKKPVVEAPPPMDSILPGVVPKQVDERFDTIDERAPRPRMPQAKPPPRETAPPPEPVAAAAPVPSAPAPSTPAPSAPDPLVAARREALDAERAAVAAERRALEAERSALKAERAAWEAKRTSGGEATTFEDVLSRRGLVGADEAERAVRALAEARRVSEMLPWLTVSDPEALLRWLRDVLVLVDGPPPEALGREALVSVAPDRAEIPGAARWRKLATQLSEKLLLNGARRVLVVGGPIRAHRLLRQGLDNRIELRFRPGERVVGPDAEADVTQTDALALWGVTEDDRAREVYDTGRALVARVESDGVQAFVKDWIRSLDGAP